jgi:hypothetical protein
MPYKLRNDFSGDGKSVVEVSVAHFPETIGLNVVIGINRNGGVRAKYSYNEHIDGEGYYLGEINLYETDVKSTTGGEFVYKTQDGRWKERDKFLLDFIENYGEDEILSKVDELYEDYMHKTASMLDNIEYIDVFGEDGKLVVEEDD